MHTGVYIALYSMYYKHSSLRDRCNHFMSSVVYREPYTRLCVCVYVCNNSVHFGG